MTIPDFKTFTDGVDGGAGGGGSEGASDLGGSPSPGGAGDGASKAYDLNDDTPIRIKGQKDPVKFGDWYKGLRGQQTKADQARAEYERKYGELESGHKTLKGQYDQLLAAVQKAREGGDKTDALKALRDLQYLSGNDAAQIVEAVQQRIQQTDAGFQTRDRAIMFLGQKLAEVMKSVGVQTGRTQQQDFQAKIANFVKSGGYGDEYKDLAQELYLAYEGNDLDEEFPTILKNRIGQIERAMRAADQKKIAARKQNMFIPGKEGPVAGPSGPLRDKRLAKGSPKQIAGAVWDAMIGDGPSDRT